MPVPKGDCDAATSGSLPPLTPWLTALVEERAVELEDTGEEEAEGGDTSLKPGEKALACDSSGWLRSAASRSCSGCADFAVLKSAVPGVEQGWLPFCLWRLAKLLAAAMRGSKCSCSAAMSRSWRRRRSFNFSVNCCCSCSRCIWLMDASGEDGRLRGRREG